MDILIPLLWGGCRLPDAVAFLVPAKTMAVSLEFFSVTGIPAAAKVMAPPLLARRMMRVLSGEGNW